jgi:hypothetical protein
MMHDKIKEESDRGPGEGRSAVRVRRHEGYPLFQLCKVSHWNQRLDSYRSPTPSSIFIRGKFPTRFVPLIHTAQQSSHQIVSLVASVAVEPRMRRD